MRALSLSALALLALAAPVGAQFRSEHALVAPEASHPLPGLAFDGLWSSQYYIGEGHPLIQAVDGGWLDVVEHRRVRWVEADRVYRGLHGREARVLPLGDRRLLLEHDGEQGGSTWVQVAQWSDGDLHFFDVETGPGSVFERHMESAGARVEIGSGGRTVLGDEIDAHVVSGPREVILAALRTLPLGDSPAERYRRPTHAEMGVIWNWFELERYVQQQSQLLRRVGEELPRAQRLGELHQVHRIVSDVLRSRLDRLDDSGLEPFVYSRIGATEIARLFQRATALLADIDARLEHRMAWVAGQVEVSEHVEKVDDPNNPFDFVNRPDPGDLLRFHLVVTLADGHVAEDTRAKGEPAQAAVMGDLPEGLQWGLRTVGYEERITLVVPAALAFGPAAGDVTVELELVERVRDSPAYPTLDGGLFGESVGTVMAQETPSGLRYRDLAPGIGASPRRGQDARIRWASWNALGDEVEGERVDNIVVGGETVMAGINEAVLSMKSGGRRVLFVPRHLAETRRDRAGMAQCVVIELIGFRE